MNRNGGFAEYLVYPVRTLHRVPSSIPFDVAVLTEPLCIAVNAVKMTMGQQYIDVFNEGVDERKGINLLPDFDYVVIFGDGPIGLLLLQVLKAIYSKLHHVVRVFLVGATPNRLETATRLGADRVHNNSSTSNDAEDLEGVVRKFGDGRMADYVFEATGQPRPVEQAIQTVKIGGKVMLLGVFGGKSANIDLDKIVLGDLTIRGTIGSPGVWPATIKLLESGLINTKPFITHRFPLSGYHEAIELIERKAGNVIKAIIVPNEK